jgi:RHS repeat-associated protein
VDPTTGAAVERYVYDAYGKVTIYSGDWSSEVMWADSKQNEVLFCGYQFNPEIGTYCIRHRPYIPRVGWSVRDLVKYADGMNLYSYARNSPTVRTDPSGLRTTTNLNCGGKSIKVMTDWCCPDDQKKIEAAVCDAYKTLVAANAALASYIKTNDWSTPQRPKPPLGPDDQATATRFRNYFESGPALIKWVTDDIEDELDDDDGTLYQCDGKKGDCDTASAWGRPYGGWAIHICHTFLHESTDKDRARVIIHELSHLYQQTTDTGYWGLPERSDYNPSPPLFLYGHDTYIKGEDASGEPVYYNTDGKTGTPLIYTYEHADTIAWFAMGWYKP